MHAYIYTYIYKNTQWNTMQELKKNEILPSATTLMDPEGIMLRKISQAEKDKYHMASLVSRI